MHSFSEIMDIIKKLKGLNNDYEVAKLLNIKQNTISAKKSRNSIPYEEIITFCHKENISLDELLTGEYKENQTGSARHIIKEEESPYESNIDKIKISEDLILTTRVLESNSPYSMALHLNIRSFAQAVEAKERISIVETNQQNMQAEIKELRKEVNRLKSTYEGPNGNDGDLTNIKETGT
jgi:hypothetical protein